MNSQLRFSSVWSVAGALVILAACSEDLGDLPDGGACTPGTANCACRPAGDCDDGLACDDGLCRGQERVGLVVLDANARSCEAVVVEDATEIFGVDFGGGVSGTHVREAPRTAVAFHRLDDAAFDPGAATVRRSMGGTLRLRRARCFDRDGNPLDGEPLRLEE